MTPREREEEILGRPGPPRCPRCLDLGYRLIVESVGGEVGEYEWFERCGCKAGKKELPPTEFAMLSRAPRSSTRRTL